MKTNTKTKKSTKSKIDPLRGIIDYLHKAAVEQKLSLILLVADQEDCTASIVLQESTVAKFTAIALKEISEGLAHLTTPLDESQVESRVTVSP